VVSYGRRQGTSRDKIQLRSEALKESCWLTRRSTPSTAPAPTSARGRRKAARYVNKLAHLFRERKVRPAIRVYRILGEEATGHRRAPAWPAEDLLATKAEQARPGHRRDEAIGGRVWPIRPGQGHAEQKGALAEAHRPGRSALRELVQDTTERSRPELRTYKLARDIYKQLPRDVPIVRRRIHRFYYRDPLRLEDWDPAAEATTRSSMWRML